MQSSGSVWRDRGWIVWLALAGYVLAFLIWLVVGEASQGLRTLISDVALPPIGLIGAALAFRASRQATLGESARLAWRRLAVGIAAFGLGDAIWCYLEVVAEIEPFPSFADLSYLAFYPLVLWGLLSFPMTFRTRADRVKFWLDALTVVVGAGAAIWYFVFLPVLRMAQVEPVEAIVALAYPVGDLLLLLSIATVLLRRPDASCRVPLRVLAAGLALMVVSDIAFGPAVLQDSYEGGSWIDMVWALAGLTMALSAQLQCWQARHLIEPVEAPDGGVTGFSPLPYAAVALGQGLVVVAAFRAWDEALGGLLLGSVLVTGLVVARQVVAVRENGRLIAEDAARRDALLQLAHRFSAESKHTSLEDDLLRAAVELVGADEAQLSRWDEIAEQLAEPRRIGGAASESALTLMTTASERVVAAGAPVLIVKPRGEGRSIVRLIRDEHVAVLAAPIGYDGRLFGVVAISKVGKQVRYSESDAEILRLLTGMAGATLLGADRARLEGALLAARTAEHELNNQLTGAAGFAELIATDESVPEPVRELAQAALESALEAARLVGEIRQVRRIVLKGGAVPDGTVIDLDHSAA